MSEWRKSSFSGNCGCVEICIGVTEVLVRDTKDRTGSILSFTFAEWQAHLDAVRNHEHEVPIPHPGLGAS